MMRSSRNDALFAPVLSFRVVYATRLALADLLLLRHPALPPVRQVVVTDGVVALELEPPCSEPLPRRASARRQARRAAVLALLQGSCIYEEAGFAWGDEILAGAGSAIECGGVLAGLPRYGLGGDGRWWDLQSGKPAPPGRLDAARQRGALARAVLGLAGYAGHEEAAVDTIATLTAAARTLGDPILASAVLALAGGGAPLARVQDLIFEIAAADEALLGGVAGSRLRLGFLGKRARRYPEWLGRVVRTAAHPAAGAGSAVVCSVGGAEGCGAGTATRRLTLELALEGWRVLPARHASPWRRLSAAAEWLSGLGCGPASSLGGTSDELARGLLAAMESIPAPGGLALAIEDFGALDIASGQLLRDLLARRWPRPLLVIGTSAGSGEFHGGANPVLRLDVKPAAAADLPSLFPLLAPSLALKEGIFEAVWRASSGNLAVAGAELAKRLEADASGLVDGRLPRTAGEAPLPAPVAHALEGALAGVSAAARRGLEAAAMGDTFTPADLEELGADVGSDDLAVLEGRGLLRRIAPASSDAGTSLSATSDPVSSVVPAAYQLEGAMLRRYLLAGLGDRDRRQLHAARALQLEGAGEAAAAERLAHLLAASERPDREAVAALARVAVARALAEGSLPEALEIYAGAAPHMPESSAEAWALGEAELLCRLGRYRDALGRLEPFAALALSAPRIRALRLNGERTRALDLVLGAAADSATDPSARLGVGALCEGVRAACTLARFDAARDLARRARQLAAAGGPRPRAEAALAAALAEIECGEAGSLLRADGILGEAEREIAAGGGGLEPELLRLRGYRALAESGPARALPYFEAAAASAYRAGDLPMAADLEADVGSASYESGNRDRAEAAYARVVALGEGIQGERAIFLGRYNQAVLAVDDLRFAEARLWLEPLLGRARERDDVRGVLYALGELGRLELRIGDLAAAAAWLEQARAVQAATPLPSRRHELAALAADLAWQRGDMDAMAASLELAVGAPESFAAVHWLSGLAAVRKGPRDAEPVFSEPALSSDCAAVDDGAALAAAARYLKDGGGAPLALAVRGWGAEGFAKARRIWDLGWLCQRRGASLAPLAAELDAARTTFERLECHGYLRRFPAPSSPISPISDAPSSIAPSGERQLFEALAVLTENHDVAAGADASAGVPLTLSLSKGAEAHSSAPLTLSLSKGADVAAGVPLTLNLSKGAEAHSSAPLTLSLSKGADVASSAAVALKAFAAVLGWRAAILWLERGEVWSESARYGAAGASDIRHPVWDVGTHPYRRDGAAAWLAQEGHQGHPSLALGVMHANGGSPAEPHPAWRLLLHVLATGVSAGNILGSSLNSGPVVEGLEGGPEAETLPGLIAASLSMRALARRARHLAEQNIDLLLLGESGTGKEKMARAIHALSKRRDGPWRAINCSAIPETLLERELFGHARGAFTGADQARPGLLEATAGGTLLIDEIGDLTPGVQVKLLRVLQEREYYRIGESRPLRADVRFLFATHKDLRREIEAGRFREDLFYRVNVGCLEIPPLRERRDDIEPLGTSFLAAACAEQGKSGVVLSAAARRALVAASWPGNVRQLQNAIASACALAHPGETLGLAHFSGVDGFGKAASRGDRGGAVKAQAGGPVSGVGIAGPGGSGGSYQEQLDGARRAIVEAALLRSQGNRTRAASDLGISRQALTYILKEIGVKETKVKEPRRAVRGRGEKGGRTAG